MSSKHRYAAALSLLVACGLGALAGCTGGAADPPVGQSRTTRTGGDATTAPTASTPTTSSPTSDTATTTEVEIPTAARAHTEAGAEAFVRFYLDQVNAAWTRPQAGLLPRISDHSCLACKGFEETATELTVKGQRYERTPASFTSITAIEGAPAGRQLVHVIGTQHRVDVVNQAGAVVSSDPEEKIAVNAMTIWRGDKWLLYDMG